MCIRMSIEWIAEGLKKPGKSKSELAKKLGRAPSMITALLKGGRELKAREVKIIADYLEIVPPDVESPEPEPQIRTAYIRGDVAGGVWAEPGLEFEPIPTTVVIDARWPDNSVYLLRVRGTSINRQARDGDLILCLDIHAAPRPFAAGDWVVAERSGHDGRLETTVKRVNGDRRSGYFLTPDSDDPAFQEPIRIGKTDGEMVTVKAFVLEFIKKGTNF
jgi:SOS-response transcriptional repressor LexA